MTAPRLYLRTRKPVGEPGKVYLVGAGPGDPELITVRGRACLRRAECVVYDRLVHPDLLEHAPPWAERIFVGKAAGLQVMGQAEINAVLVERALAGETVVRLKGGDPFVFGRGSEEAEALHDAGIEWEVVPAVSSALGVPARAGIPVTARGVASNFAVVTAQKAPREPLDGDDSFGLDWGAMAAVDTLVVLMGVAVLPVLGPKLVAAGRSRKTPVAVIERGTLVTERVHLATLETLATVAAEARIEPPATIVVGEVVALGQRLTSTLAAGLIDSAANQLGFQPGSQPEPRPVPEPGPQPGTALTPSKTTVRTVQPLG